MSFINIDMVFFNVSSNSDNKYFIFNKRKGLGYFRFLFSFYESFEL